MIQIDIRTILFSYFVTNILLALFMVSLWLENRKHFVGIGFWVCAYFMHMLGVLMSTLRGLIPDFWSILVGNVVVTAGMLFMLIGLECFVEQPRSQRHNWAILAGFAASIAYYTYIDPNLSIRIVIAALGVAIFAGQVSWLLLRRVAHSQQPITRHVGVIFLGYVLTSAMRILFVFTLPPVTDFMRDQTWDTLMLFINQLLSIVATVFLIQMINRHLFHKIQTAEAKHAGTLARHRDELETMVAERTHELASVNTQLTNEIAERRRTAIRRQALLDINRMSHATEQEILDFALEQSLRITESRVGYIYHYSETTRLFTLFSWSKDVMQECTILDPQTVYELDKTGIWGEAVRQRKTIMVNDFAAPNDLKKGYPEGHVQLTRYLTIPVFEDDHIVAVFGVGNKVAPYDAHDESELTLLAQGVWSALRHQRDEHSLRESEATARAILNSIFESLILIEADGTVVEINAMGAQRLGHARADLIGKNIYDFLPAEVIATRRQKVDLAFQTDQPIVFEDERSERVIKQSVIAVSGNANQKKRLAIFAQDITEQKRIEAEMRQTADLLEATRNAQSLYLANGNLDQVAGQLLQTLCQITSSQYGFLDEVLRDEDGKLYKRSLAMSNIAWDAGSQRLYEMLVNQNLEFRNSNNLASAPIVTGNLVITNDRAHDPRSGGLPEGHPSIQSFMGIPLYFGQELIGVVGVANRAGGYSQAIAKFLEPFTTTCASIIYAARKDRHEQEITAALAQSEERFRIVSQISTDFAFSFHVLPDGSLHQEWITDSYDQISGFTLAERNPTGVTPLATVHPADLPGVEQIIREHIATCTPAVAEFRIITKSGAFRILHAQLKPIWDDTQQRVVRLIGGGSDVTQRKQAEQELEIALTKYKTLFDAFPLGISISDQQGQIIEANPASERLLGIPTQEHTQRAIDSAEWQIIRPDGSPMPTKEYASVRALQENQRVENVEMGIAKPGEPTTWINVTAAPIPLPGYGIAVTYNDITERKRAEVQLRASEEKYRVLYRDAALGIAQTTLDGHYISMNPALARMLGYDSPEQAIAAIHDIASDTYVNPAQRNAWVNQVLNADETIHYENDYRRRDGTIWNGLVHLRIVKDAQGQPSYLESFVEDITERKQAEQALRESEWRNKIVSSMITDYVFVVDVEPGELFKLRWASDNMFRMTGRTLTDAATSDMWRNIIHPDDTSRFFEFAHRIVTTAQPGELECRALYKNGDTRWIQIFAQPLHDDSHTVHTIVGAIKDITERKAQEQALRNSEERYRTLIETANEGIWTIDANAMTTFVNTKMAEMLGYTVEEMLGKSLYEFMDAEGRQIAENNFERRRQGIIEQHDFKFQCKDGQPIWCLLSTNPLLYNGQFVGALATVLDITARKQTEDQLLQLNLYHRNLIEASLDPLVTIMPNGKIGDVNTATEIVTGRTREELIGTDFADCFTEPDQARAGYQRVFAQGTVRDYELAIQHKDGHITPVLYNATVYRGEQNQIAGVFATARDMTARKQAEADLHTAVLQWQTTFDALSDAICLLDRDLQIIRANSAMANILEKEPANILGQVYYKVIYESNQPIPNCPIVRMTQSHQRETHDVLIGNAWYTITADPLLDESGELSGAIQTMHNITERKIFENTLSRKNQDLDQYVHQLGEQNHQMLLLSQLGDVLQTCQTSAEAYALIPRFMQELFPDHAGALFIRDTPQELFEAADTWGNLSPDDQVLIATECWALRRNRPHAYAEDGLVCPHLHGTPRPHICVPLYAQNELLGMFHLRTLSANTPVVEHDRAYIALAENVAEHLALALTNLHLQEILREQAIRDPLTGLHNRRYMEDTLERELRRAARSQRPVSIISADLDHLKTINDQLGHDAGDEALRLFGALLKQSIRSGDVACRFGGDEFLLILTDAALNDAKQRAIEIQHAIHAIVISRPDMTPIHLSMSAGVAEFPTHGAYPQTILRAADAALYRAKTAGRDCVKVAEVQT